MNDLHINQGSAPYQDRFSAAFSGADKAYSSITQIVEAFKAQP